MGTIRSRVLECGMPLIVEPMEGVGSVAITWSLPLGSATDPEGAQGLSTMWSEMVFRGAGLMDSRAHADALDRLGLARSSDLGTFHLRLSFTLVGARLPEALPVIAEMVRRPRCDAAAVDPVRELALQALAGLRDDPYERAVLAARARHADVPLNRSGLGTAGGLAAVTRDAMLAAWEGRVRPVGSVLAIAGAVPDEGEIARVLDRVLAGWSGEAPRVTPQPNPAKGSYHHEQDDSAQVQIVLLHDGPPEPSPDAIAERVVTSVLSGGMAARLFSEVREKRGLCYAVSASYGTERTYGRSLAYVGTTPERAQQSLEVLLAELARINRPEGTVSEDEFARALTGIQANLVFAGESTGARAAALASDQLKIGRPRPLDELRARYRALTLGDVRAYLARRELGEVTVVTLGPAALRVPERS